MRECIILIDDDAPDEFTRAVTAEKVQDLVRCGECKHQTVFEYTDRRFKNPVRKVYGCELSEYSHVCLDDEFCSSGERKGEEVTG